MNSRCQRAWDAGEKVEGEVEGLNSLRIVGGMLSEPQIMRI